MKIEVNIEKRWAFAIFGVLLVVSGILVAMAAVTPNPGHSPSQVGGDGDININGKFVGNEFCVGADCVDDWDSLRDDVGGGSGGSSGDPWSYSGMVVAGRITETISKSESSPTRVVLKGTGGEDVALTYVQFNCPSSSHYKDLIGQVGRVLDVDNGAWRSVCGYYYDDGSGLDRVDYVYKARIVDGYNVDIYQSGGYLIDSSTDVDFLAVVNRAA